MAKTNFRSAARMRRKRHIRKSVRGSAARPRLSVFRTSKHIYAQIIDDDAPDMAAVVVILTTDVDDRPFAGLERFGVGVHVVAHKHLHIRFDQIGRFGRRIIDDRVLAMLKTELL